MKHPIQERKDRQRAQAERLKSFSGAGFMGYLFATFSKGPAEKRAGPQFIRRGYEASIIEELREFFIGRGWRPARCRPKITHKERENHLRRAEAAGVIRRCGGGRFELVRKMGKPDHDFVAIDEYASFTQADWDKMGGRPK